MSKEQVLAVAAERGLDVKAWAAKAKKAKTNKWHGGLIEQMVEGEVKGLQARGLLSPVVESSPLKK